MSRTGIDYRQICERHAGEYDAMVAVEDCDGHLLPALQSITPLAGAAVLEVGAGTGRVTRLLLDAGARVVATEPALAMLDVARRHTAQQPAARCALLGADALALPVRAGWEAATRATGFFFGGEFAARVQCEGWSRIPECTGLWWRRTVAGDGCG